MIKSKHLYAIVIMLMFSGLSSAKECYEKSPNWVKQKDRYFDVQSERVITNAESAMLDIFSSKVVGAWSGESSYVECKGPDRNATQKISSYWIEGTVKKDSNGNITLSAEKTGSDNIQRPETISLPAKMRIFEVEVTSDRLVLSERMRKAIINNDRKMSRHVETIYEVAIKGKLLTFIRSYYSNGVFIAEEKWNLSRQ